MVGLRQEDRGSIQNLSQILEKMARASKLEVASKEQKTMRTWKQIIQFFLNLFRFLEGD